MIYIFEGGSIVYDGTTLNETQKNNAIVVTEKPVEEHIEGKMAILKWDIETQTAWYEYEDIPKTQEEIQQEKINQFETALLEMSTLSTLQQAQNEQAILELTTLIGGLM